MGALEGRGDWLVEGPPQAACTVALAHGAGAGMDTDFMDYFAAALANSRVRVVRFEFPYMVASRQTGKRRPPDREPVLRQAWQQVVEALAETELVMGGKSMGGRLASMLAESSGARAVVCLGYPFHPVGKPDRPRIEHLQTIGIPTLILQGERDPFGNRQEVEQYRLSSCVQVHWVPEGDHSFKPRKASGRTLQQNWAEAASALARFLDQV